MANDEREALMDVAQQFRIANGTKQLLCKIGEQRVKRAAEIKLWAIGFGVAFILGGLALAALVAPRFVH